MARSATRQQKRKRDEPLNEKTSISNEEHVSTSLPPAKKTKEAASPKKLKRTAAEVVVTQTMNEKMEVDVSSVEKIDVWIGATDATKKIGLYYGTATDTRNWIGVPELEPESSLEDACVWAAIQAIERCGNDTKNVFIYTDCRGLCTDENRNPLREKLNEKISQRSGSTVILHTLATTSSQLQEAQELVVVKQNGTKETNGDDSAVEVEQEEEEQGIKKATTTTEDIEKDTESLKVSEAVHNEEEMQRKSNDVDEGITKDASASSGSSWKPTGGLARNLLDILMSPFTRKTRTQ